MAAEREKSGSVDIDPQSSSSSTTPRGIFDAPGWKLGQFEYSAAFDETSGQLPGAEWLLETVPAEWCLTASTPVKTLSCSFAWSEDEELQGGCDISLLKEAAMQASRLICLRVLAIRTDRRRLGSGSSWPRWYLLRETENTNCRWLSQVGLLLSETSTSSGVSLRFCPFMIIFKLQGKE